MLQRRPILLGCLLSLCSHAAVWLAVYASAATALDVLLLVAFVLLLGRLVLYFCLNLNALHGEGAWRRLRFAASFILVALLLTLGELPLLDNGELLSLLDPHSSFMTGLAYVIMWFAVAIEIGIELLITAIQLLILLLRDRLSCRK
jgi:hypothetical protein